MQLQNIVERYLQITTNMNQLEKEQKDLRAMMIKMAGIGEHQLDGYQLTITKQKRESLDKETVLKELGLTKYQTCIKETEYEIVRVKAVDKE
jgi:hypothetical protein